MLRRCALVLSLLSLLLSASAALADNPPNFEQLGPVFDAFRRGGSSELVIRRGEKTVQVLKGTDTRITAEAGAALAAKSKTLPSLKFAADGVWLESSVSKNQTVLRPITSKGADDPSRKWKTHDLVRVVQFTIAYWPEFTVFAIKHGMSGAKEFQYKGEAEVVLLFSPITPPSLPAGTRTLQLNSDFASVMRVSPKYPAKSGSKGFVVLLHDPHWDINGRFETLAGLRALTAANRAVTFRFLVEGAYNDIQRTVPMAGLETLIRQGAAGDAAIVSKLLRSYLINTPMAYRLLYDRAIDTRAIDNNELLKYDAPRPQRSTQEQLQSLRSVMLAVSKPAIDEQIKSKVQELVVMTTVFLAADIDDVSDVMLIEHFDGIADMYLDIVRVGGLLRKAGINVDQSQLTALGQDALGWKDQAEQFRKAHKRNETMIPQIVAVARETQRVPIAFIGSYHTQGIIAGLQAQSIGYVVVEPRPRRSATEAELRAFDLANHFNTREAYLSSAKLNMGVNGPTPKEVTTFYKPRIEQTLPEFESQLAMARREFASQQNSALQVDKLISTAKLNSSLAPARISAGGNGAVPPPELRTAFAFFEPGDGKGGRFVVPNAADKRWTENDRYDFLRLASFIASESSKEVKVARNVAFYPHAESNRLFMTVYDPRSKRIYCMEGDRQQAALLVPLPNGNSTRGIDIRAQVAELLARLMVDAHG